MILIDRNKAEQDLVLTLTENTTVEAPDYTLVIINDADKTEHSISLTGKLAYTNQRFDLFILSTTLFDGMPVGFYTYSIYEDLTMAEAIETGKLLIRGQEQSLEIITPIRKDEFIIYK